jgi:hypothetical protein
MTSNGTSAGPVAGGENQMSQEFVGTTSAVDTEELWDTDTDALYDVPRRQERFVRSTKNGTTTKSVSLSLG